MMLKEAKPNDIDTLFSMYTDDFVYIHDVYGGLYPRASLYEKSLRNMQAGHFNMSADRCKILNIMTSLNAAAVERLEINSGQVHLSIFELKGDKVPRSSSTGSKPTIKRPAGLISQCRATLQQCRPV
ncbi:hypothetical protein [Chitinimonas taiwanensis]|uniref:hypothetical protein n=1 Tax=Chitinimonas taiwanensis TaxID=240412 RepID=UPI000931FBE5|nr:hypothetical protein [Chitinimonas taiwanensis]